MGFSGFFTLPRMYLVRIRIRGIIVFSRFFPRAFSTGKAPAVFGLRDFQCGEKRKMGASEIL